MMLPKSILVTWLVKKYLLATKVLVTSLFFVRVDTSKSQQDSVNFGGPLAFLVICGVLYFIYRMSSRLRAKVNEMHVGRGASDAPLIKKRWSLLISQ